MRRPKAVPYRYWRMLLPLVLCATGASAGVGEASSVEVGRFPQEIATRFTVGEGLPSNDLRRAVAIGPVFLLPYYMARHHGFIEE
jgi:hypothetical protein